MAKAKAPNVTEWLIELARVSNRSDEGMTSHEWADAMGVEQECALRRLKEAHKLGWLKVGRRRTTSLDGRPGLTPVYQVVRPDDKP